MSKEDDWTGTTNAAARRRAQTRLNTRAYRKRKALAKKSGESSISTDTDTMIKSEMLVECWDFDKQSISLIPTSQAKQLYNPRRALLPSKPGVKQFDIIFPPCPDHLIPLLQINALRALAVNRTLISGILATPLDCAGSAAEEIIHTIPYPSNPKIVPPTLLPTVLQQTVPHCDWIDLFPSPEGRDRLILASGTFDEDDLWADCVGGLYEGFPEEEITKRGFVAWSPPWDISGWEMSEGFLSKWGWLVKGLPGILEATNRWRIQRGEEPLPDDGTLS
ncbi:hypothetical protein ONS95_001537 [Cadophora gregata]|uniref:uncharacterized protein n=1 Tax=Cadophora gregata TaxID=51156 RepID=UPI0026DCE3B2|nr:uncharacterized protein ONS95_001537 [Cadophora gregata]KAK0111160.1 hypothetical protein ONS95_001537 [Cadophora gregata]KAK0112372.1 hypothetical protein ONS96_001615 [Cadophora gregata f. sp. sojae]